jgi:cell division protease FtsH
MSEKVGPVTLAPRENPFLSSAESSGFGTGDRPYSEATAQLVDAEVRRILQEGYDAGVHLLRQHRSRLDALAKALLEKETLDEEEVLRVTGLPPSPRLAGTPLVVPQAAFSIPVPSVSP